MTDQAERKSSTHKVEVVRVKPERHPNADRLMVVPVYGYSCCISEADWAGVSRDGGGRILAAYVPPDSVVDATRPEFSFLREKPVFDADGTLIGRVVDEKVTEVRTKARKLRGVVSYGFLIPAPEGAKEGEDLAEALAVKHYEPPLEEEKGAKNFAAGGEIAPGPDVYCVKYDVDAFRRYNRVVTAEEAGGKGHVLGDGRVHLGVLVPGEPVVVTEKLDGSNARYVYTGGKMHCGSRTEWKREFATTDHVTVEGLVGRGVPEEKARELVDRLKSKAVKKNLWWYALERCPVLEQFCRHHPDHVVYGEVFGRQGKLKYTDRPDEVFFAALDIMKDGRWVDAPKFFDLMTAYGVPTAPLLNDNAVVGEWGELPGLSFAKIDYDFDAVTALAEGKSLWNGASCLREGVVVRPFKERYDPEVGRVQLKIVSASYLEKYR